MLRLSSLLGFLFLLALLVTSLPFVVGEGNIVELMVSTGEPYYLRGETAQVVVTGNASMQYVLSVVNPLGVIVYENIRQTNIDGLDVVNLPIPESFVSGTYMVQAVVASVTATTWVSIVETSGYEPQVFPYVKQHKNINFTIHAKGFQAVSPSGDLTIQYPTLPISFSVSAYANNMSFIERLRNNQLGIEIDLCYLFIHKGLKLVINGSIPQAASYTFSFQSPRNLLKKLDALQDGSLIFDWSDMRKAMQAFTYNPETNQLTVNIPESFKIDPYVFEDGFESGDLSAWTGSGIVSIGAIFGNCTTSPHHGSYCANATSLKPADNSAKIYKNVDAATEYYIRSYVKVDVALDGDGYQWIGVGYMSGSASSIAASSFNVSSGKWGVDYYNGGWVPVWETGTSTFSANTWYCVELYTKIDGSAGVVTLWVDGVLKVNQTGLDTNDRGNIASGQLITYFLVAESDYRVVYWDCAVIDTSPIGVEAGGDSSAPTYSDISASTTGSGASATLSCYWNDETDLTTTGGYIFSTNNTSTWSNDTWTAFTATPQWANVSKTLATAVGQVVGYMWYANDTAGNWNNTGIQTLTVTGYTLTLQARDNTGVNLPRAVTFTVTFPNTTVTAFTSSTAGLRAITTMNGSHSVTVTWQSHIVKAATTVDVTAATTQNFDTLITRLSSGSNYVLVSVDSTSLNTPLLMPNNGWMIQSIQGIGNCEVKVDHLNWLLSGEPRFFKVRGSLYERGCNDWSWTNSIFTWSNLDFTLLEYADIEMVWTLADATIDDSGTTTVTPAETVDSDSDLVVTPGYIPVSPPPTALYWILMLGGGAFAIVFIISVKPDTRWPKPSVGKTQFPKGKGKKPDRKRWKKK